MTREEFGIENILIGIWRRKLLGLAVFTATVILVGIATLAAPKSYFSESKLFVRLGRENVGVDPTATLGEGSAVTMPLSREAEINSIAEIVKSKHFLAKVVDEIGPAKILDKSASDNNDVQQQPPSTWDQVCGWLKQIGVLSDLELRERAILRLQKKVSVDAVERSNVLNIEFTSYSPKLAQSVVAALTKTYLAEHGSINRNSKAYEFLREQTHGVRTELEQSEDLLAKLKRDRQILSVDHERTTRVARLARIQDELLQVNVTINGLNSEIDRLQQFMDAMPDTRILESKTGAGNEGVDGMRQQLFQLEIQRERLLSKNRKEHPLVKQIQEQVEQMTKRLAKEESSRTEQTIGPNIVMLNTETELVLKKSQLEAHQAKADELKQQLAQVQKDQAAFTQDEIEYARLQRAVTIQDYQFRKYAHSLSQAKIDHDLGMQSISNISVGQPATLNPKPASPNKLVNLVLGVMLGFCNAIGFSTLLEFLSYRKRIVQTKSAEESSRAPRFRLKREPHPTGGDASSYEERSPEDKVAIND